jgi:EthD domain
VVLITFLLKRRADLSPEDFHTYWREEHGPLVASHAETLGIRRYLQLHTLDSPLGVAVAAGRACAPTDWDGVALIWFEREETIVERGTTEAGEAAALALYEDEQRFLDLERCELFLTEDHELVG